MAYNPEVRESAALLQGWDSEGGWKTKLMLCRKVCVHALCMGVWISMCVLCVCTHLCMHAYVCTLMGSEGKVEE